jgi:hypothetical protein
MFDVSLLSVDDYIHNELLQDEIPEKYLCDENGDFILASGLFYSENEIKHLIHFLFQGCVHIAKDYQFSSSCILDVTSCRKSLIDFDYLEKFYDDWLLQSGRENSMDEYGLLINYIGFGKKGNARKHMLIVVVKRNN